MSRARHGDGDDERQARTAPAATQDEAAWTSPITASRRRPPSATRSTRLLARSSARVVDEVRSLLDELTGRWRGDAVRVGEGTRQRLRDLFRELGLVTRDDWDELELRVAQLEHRLHLLEDRQTRPWPTSA